MKRYKKLVYALIFFMVAVTIAIVVGVYSIVTNNIIEKTTLNNISEIATHDRNTITMFVEFNIKNLSRIGQRLKRNAEDLESKRSINEYLGYEAYESTFDKVYLLMEDGSYYTDITYRQDENTPDYYDYGALLKNGNYKAAGFDSLPVMNSDKVVIYAYELRGELDGIKIGADKKKVRAVIGVTKRSSIVDGLIIESYADDEGNVRGYSSVVNLDGDYIVDREDFANHNSDNWLEIIENSDRSDLTRAQVEEKMGKGETFWFYQESGGVRELNYCIPLSGTTTDWYFLMSVNDAALAEQTNSFVWMIVTALCVTVAVIIVAMVVMMIMQKKTAKAYAQEKAQSEFLSNMSHEIRTPLNGLVGLNYLMMTSIDDPAKHNQIKEWLSKSHGTAKYLLSLINDILDISKLRAGKVEVSREPLLVEAVVEAIQSMQFDNIKNREIEYISEVNITVPCILGDEVHVKQVLMNIVGNAAKFTPAGGKIKLTVSQSLTDEKHVVTTFVCEDTGCGMNKEFLTKIFDAFTQDRNSNSGSTKGTGLGMAISKLLVDAMGGEISVESEQGKGSKFTVTLPAEIAEIPEYLKFTSDEEAEPLPSESAEEAKPLKVLVAEDNELNAEILMHILKDAGFDVVHAANGEEAVEIFQSSAVGEISVILMDMRMPVLDGCGASSMIRNLEREDAKSVLIFACTANTFKEDQIKAFESGMNDFLTKPIDIKVLLQKMEHVNRDKNGGGSGE